MKLLAKLLCAAALTLLLCFAVSAKEVVVYEENGAITAEFFLDTVTYPDAESRIKGDVRALNKTMPAFKQISKIKTRDKEFPKTTTLKIKRKYK